MDIILPNGTRACWWRNPVIGAEGALISGGWNKHTTPWMEEVVRSRMPEDKRRQIESADTETLLEWSERVLTANSLDEVLH